MTALLVLIAFFALASWGFAAATTRLAGKPLSIWQALGIIFTAKLITRGTNILFQGQDVWTRVGINLAVYLVVLTIGLIATARVRPLVALALSAGFTALLVAGTTVFILAGVLNSPPPRPAP